MKQIATPKIIYVIGSLEIGGAEMQLYSLVRNIQNRHHDCHVFSFTAAGPLLEPYQKIGVPLHFGGLNAHDALREKPWKLAPAQWQLIRVIRKERPQVVHSFLPLATFMGAVAGRLCGVPMVISSRRALGTHHNRVPLTRPMDYIAHKLSHRVTVNSRAVYEDTIKRDRTDPSKLVLIYNGIDSEPAAMIRNRRDAMRKRLRIRPDEKVVIVAANLIPYKGHGDFLRALPMVIRRVSNLKVLFAGEDRGIQFNLEKLAAHLKVSQFISFLGRRNDVPQLLSAGDLSVLPSHEEGFSNVILESMASGLPVVATRVGGNAEAIIDGETGWLVEVKNPHTLAEKIVDLLNDPVKAKEWGKENRVRVQNLFTMEKMVNRYLKLYRQGRLMES